jgi:hypothetical protein
MFHARPPQPAPESRAMLRLVTLSVPGDTGAQIIVRLMRHWVAAREENTVVLPSLVELAASLGAEGHVAVALDSLLALTEACLERPLRTECCCSRNLTADEAAVLTLIETARIPAGAATSGTVPHGLPGVLAWAATMVRQRIAEDGHALPRAERGADARCPFAA